MDRYKYSVTPFSPIRELIPGKSIRAPFSADLNEKEVFLCMKHGPVYRLFPGKDPIKVTGSNFKYLHVAKYGDTVEKEIVVGIEDSPVVEEKNTEEVSPAEEIKIVDREETRENFTVDTSDIEENIDTVDEENQINEEIPVESENVEDPESFECSDEEQPVEENITDSENTSEYNEVEEDKAEIASSSNYNPQYKPNYSKKNKKHRNHN